ncbi:MAG TPA: hypothetical protein VF899_11935 [Pyrinomonadaceae bacterium]
MIQNFDKVKTQLGELATVINSFKSEAVQLRIIELILGAQTEETAAADVKTTPRRATRRNKSQSKRDDASDSPKKAKAPGGTGAVATLSQLASGTFFDKPRTIKDLIDHCKHNLARTFKANEFSGKLGRMVRNGELTRKKNADKQYEYKKP